MKQDIRTHANEMLGQLEDIIRLFLFQPDHYTQQLPILHRNSIGKHVRHILEFFQCLDFAVEGHLVDYDQRKRNLELESNPQSGIEMIHYLKNEMLAYEEKTLCLQVDYGKGKCEVATTLFRELVYNIEHTVHHLAIIKIGMEKHFPELKISENMGVAYSTQQYQKAS